MVAGRRVRVGFRLTESSARIATALSKPQVWAAYRAKILDMVTLQAKSVIQTQTAKVWKNPTGGLDNSWFSNVNHTTGRGTIWNSKAYAYWLNFGVRPHQMTYLLNSEERTYMAWGQYPYQARPPIPLKIQNGLAFRRVTVEAMQAGKWMHPGYAPYSFVEQGMEYYRNTQMPRDISGLLVQVLEENV